MDTSESDSKTMVRLTSYDPNNTSIEKDLLQQKSGISSQIIEMEIPEDSQEDQNSEIDQMNKNALRAALKKSLVSNKVNVATIIKMAANKEEILASNKNLEQENQRLIEELNQTKAKCCFCC